MRIALIRDYCNALHQTQPLQMKGIDLLSH